MKKIISALPAFLLVVSMAIPCCATDWYRWLDRYYFEYDDNIRLTISAQAPEEIFWDWYDDLSESEQSQVKIPVTYQTVVSWSSAEKEVTNEKSFDSGSTDRYDNQLQNVTYTVISQNRLERARKNKNDITAENSDYVSWIISHDDIDEDVKGENISVNFGDTNISDKLAKAAVKRNSGIAKSRFTVGKGTDNFCFTGELNIKLGTKYSGNKAKLYRYDNDSNRLICVDKCDINEKGYAAFEVGRAGDYIAVIY